ncbi:hypothetical protein [Embleya sp. AB8]|uniref:hypothetical protein n=1 Tax=Embleya sp. AB8 TaxID=3156304 RepID=UPI003C7830F7
MITRSNPSRGGRGWRGWRVRVLALAVFVSAVVALLALPPVVGQDSNPCTPVSENVPAPHALHVAAERADNLVDRFRHKSEVRPTSVNSC